MDFLPKKTSKYGSSGMAPGFHFGRRCAQKSSGVFGMNVLTILKRDHATVKSLFNKYSRTGKSSQEKKIQLFERIRRELQIHSRAEEEIFYPAVKAMNGTE